MDRASRPRSRTRSTALRSVLNISEARLAGYVSFGLAATLLLAALTYVLLPGHPTDSNGTLLVAGTAPGWFRFLYGMLALGGVFGLAVVGPIASLAGDGAQQWVAWARRLAYVGFAVLIVQGVRTATVLPDLGALYHGCFRCPNTLAEQQAIARGLFENLPIDPNFLVIFGGISLWTLAVSVSAILSQALPRALCYLGLALTVAYWLMILSLTIGQLGFFAVVLVISAVFLGPLWYIWLGALLTARR